MTRDFSRVQPKPKAAWIFVACCLVFMAVGVVTALVGCGRGRSGAQPDLDETPELRMTVVVETPSPGARQDLAPTAGVRLLTPEATPSPTIHVVREGDTLSGIALTYGVSLNDLIEANSLDNPDLLRVGQEILVPALVAGQEPRATLPAATAPATVIPTAAPPLSLTVHIGTAIPTPTTTGPPVVEISQVLGSSILGEEVVVVRNRGGAVSLGAWTLTGGQGAAFAFPTLTLYPSAEVRVHTKTGTSTPRDLYWGLVEPAWHPGELVTLRDGRREVVDTYIVP